MKIFKKSTLVLALALNFFSLSAFKKHSWQHEDAGLHTNNILEQFFPDQNAFRLFDMVPHELRHLPYAIYPVSKGYDTARLNFNKRFIVFPKAIFAPRTNEELIHVFKALKKHKLHFSVRSGGHCLEPGSLSSNYIIDLRNFHELSFDTKKREAVIGAGVRLGTVIETLGEHDYAIPTGTCSSVGNAGLALGGGVGFLGRQFGLTCDSVKSITLLNAEGKIIEVNSKKHPDLFWALRGAGNGSYGIVTSITYKIHHVPKTSWLNLTFEWDKKTIPHIIKAWQAWVETLPHTISTELHLIYQNKKLKVEVVALKVGKDEFTEWKSAFEQLHPKVSITKGSYLDNAPKWADRAPFPFLKGKSDIMMKPIGDDAIQASIEYFEQLKEKKEPFFAFFEFEAFGGSIPKTKTAFFPRKAFGWWYQAIYWDREDFSAHALHLQRKFHEKIAPFVSKFAYANIVDYDLKERFLEAYYGDHVDRLMEIKKDHDPENIFRWKQSIPLHK